MDKKGDKMGFIEMMRKTNILQRIMIVVSILWILLMIDANWRCKSELKSQRSQRGQNSSDYRTVCRFDIGDFASGGFIPIVLGWGSYWIIIEIMRKRKSKKGE